jgi:hypothetical protein
MPKKHELECANFLLHFGENRVLLDLAEEIVIPAFADSRFERFGSETRYFFQDVHLLNLGTSEQPIVAVVGRHVKDTTLHREQVYNDSTDRLVKDQGSLRTSPSALFVLILNNHRLLYFAETRSAPGLQSFQTTARSCLRSYYEEYVYSLYTQQRDSGVTRQQLHEEYGKLKLNIIPLSDTSDLSQFIERYEILKTARIDLITTNNEIDNEGFIFIEQARLSKEAALSEVTTITHHNSDGLSKRAVAAQMRSAVRQGNAKIVLRGQDRDGNRLEGNNDNFKVRVTLQELPATLDGLARKCYEQFELLRKTEYIQIGTIRDNVIGKIEQIRDHWNL